MDWTTILAILGIVVSVAFGFASLVYAWRTNKEKQRLEDLIRAQLRGLAGNIEHIRRNPEWCDHHFNHISNLALQLDHSDTVIKIIRHAHDGARDATAGARMTMNLLNEILTLQEGMFDTRLITYVDTQTGAQRKASPPEVDVPSPAGGPPEQHAT